METAVPVNPFTAARPYLWNGQSRGEPVHQRRFLCHSLTLALSQSKIDINCYTIAKTMITTRLGPDYRFVEAFLCNKVGVSLEELTPEAVQEYRFLWLAQLEQLWNQGERK